MRAEFRFNTLISSVLSWSKQISRLGQIQGVGNKIYPFIGRLESQITKGLDIGGVENLGYFAIDIPSFLSSCLTCGENSTNICSIKK